MGTDSNQKWFLLIGAALAVATVAVYYQIHSFDFVSYDDNVYVYDNPNIQAGITAKGIKWAFTTGHTGNWHPLTWLCHMLSWQLFGSNPTGHHLMSLVFHIANTLLLFIVLRRMTHALWQSAFVAALFALHPLHIESVAWIAERKDVLSTFFWLLTMWAYVRYVNQPKTVNYLLVLLFFALGLMSKPMLVTLPFVLLLLDYWPCGRIAYKKTKSNNKKNTVMSLHPKTIPQLVLEKVPLFILSAISSVITFIAQRGGGAVMSTSLVPLKLRISNAFVSYAAYIGKMFWPSRLAVFYPYPVWKLTVWSGAVPLLLLLAISVMVLWLAKSRRYMVTGWFWYLGTLLPVIGLVQVGSQSMADRYTYIPLTGLFIIIAWGVPDLLAKWTSASSVEPRYKQIVLAVSGLMVVAAMSTCTYSQLCYWQNNEALFRHAINVTEKNHIAHLHLAESLYSQHRLAEAVDEFQKFILLIPDDPNVLNKLGASLLLQGKLDEATVWFTKSLRIKPGYADAHANLGYALKLQGDINGAFEHLTEATRLDPKLPTGHYHLGHVLAQMGQTKKAITQLEEALRLKPDSVQCMNDLAWFLATTNKAEVRDPDRATQLAERVCQLTNYKKTELLDTLATAYAASGDFDQAIETAHKALELCQSPEQEALKHEIEERLALYDSGKPYVESR